MRLFYLLPVFALSAAACGSPSFGTGGGLDAEAVTVEDVVDGEYVATTAGPFVNITFLDSVRFTSVQSDGCANDAHTCTLGGIYTLSGNSITLVYSEGGKSSTLPFTVVSAGKPTSVRGLHVLGNAATSGLDAGAGGGGTLVEQSLVGAFQMSGQSFIASAGGSTGSSGTGSGTTTKPGSGGGVTNPGGGDDAGPVDEDGGEADGGEPDGGGPPVDIAMKVVTGADGTPKATVQVSVGGSAPFTAIIDTGSVGLRVAPGVVPDSAWTVSATAASSTYGGTIAISGVVASAAVTVGTMSGGMLTTHGPINVVKVTGVACASGVSSCADASPFLFEKQYGGVLGVGLHADSDLALISPFAALGWNQQYALRLPGPSSSDGVIEIDPSQSEFASVQTQIGLKMAGGSVTGVNSWDDTQIPFCLNGFCANGILDTGSPAEMMYGLQEADYGSIGVDASATTVPGGTQVSIDINMGVEWAFTVGNLPKLGVDDIILSSASGTNDLGIAPFRQFDVLYDYGMGTVGLVPKD